MRQPATDRPKRMTMGNQKKSSKDIDPLTPDFWNHEREILYEILFPLISAATLSGAAFAFEELAGMVTLGIGFDVVNDAVIRWSAAHTTEVVNQITKTSMAAFIDKFDPWLNSGKHLDSLIEDLTPFYGPVRAEMVAVTEVTRAFALGNMATWRASGVVKGFNWMTAEDDRVCVICSGQADGNPYGMDADTPPLHVRDRCWLQPIVPI